MDSAEISPSLDSCGPKSHCDCAALCGGAVLRVGEPCGKESIDADLGRWGECQLQRNIGHVYEFSGDRCACSSSLERIGTGWDHARNAKGCRLTCTLRIGSDRRDQLGGDATPGDGVAGISRGGEAHHGAVKQGGLRRTIPEINGIAHRAMIGRAARVRRGAALR